MSQFEEHKKEIQDDFVSANNALEQKVGSYFSDLNNKFSNLLSETTVSLNQLQQGLQEAEDKRRNEFKGMKSEQDGFFKEVKSDISKADEKTSLFMKEQSGIIDKLQRRNNIYKVISVSAIIVSIATILFVFLR